MNKYKILNIRLLSLIVSLCLFIVSLTQTAFYVDQPVDSLYALIGGWISLKLGDYASISWLANVFISFAWFFCGFNRKISLLFSMIATALAISFLFFNKVITNEAGVQLEITQYGLGYLLWLTSCITMLLGNLSDFVLKE